MEQFYAYTKTWHALQRDPDFPEHSKLFDIREQLTPLWRLTYAEQLQEKFASVAALLCGLSWNLARRIGDDQRPTWLQAALSGSQRLCCPLLVRRAEFVLQTCVPAGTRCTDVRC